MNDMNEKAKRRGKIFYQGEPGAHSHLACIEACPERAPCPATSFADLFAAIANRRGNYAMVPVENALAGRVGDVHHLLAHADIEIIGEHFQPVRHDLLALRGAKLADLRFVLSHAMALGQCRKLIAAMKLTPLIWADTAGAARWCAGRGDKRYAALASPLAGQLHQLRALKRNIADAPDNMTRFLILRAAQKAKAARKRADGGLITSFVFALGNVPAALYKTLGGFATNNVNMTRLESFPIEGGFAATHFYADIEGGPEDAPVARAFAELDFFARSWRILGTYPASPVRAQLKGRGSAARKKSARQMMGDGHRRR